MYTEVKTLPGPKVTIGRSKQPASVVRGEMLCDIFSDARDKIISEGADKTWWNKARALYLKESTFSLFFLLNHSFCLPGPMELFSHSSNRVSTLRTSLRCKNQPRSWSTRWPSYTFFFSFFLTQLDLRHFSFLTFPHPGDQPVRQGVGG